jgi:hypothetical protein
MLNAPGLSLQAVEVRYWASLPTEIETERLPKFSIRTRAQRRRGRGRARSMQKRERRRRGGGKTGRVRLIAAIRRQRFRRPPMQRRQRRAGAIDNRNWDKPCNVAPAIEVVKIIRPHQPDELHAGTAPFQIRNRLIRVAPIAASIAVILMRGC